MKAPRETPSSLKNVGSDHYKDGGIEPVEYIDANRLNFFEGNIVKYATRHRKAGGKKDVQKLIHYARMILDFEYGLDSEITYSEPKECN